MKKISVCLLVLGAILAPLHAQIPTPTPTPRPTPEKDPIGLGVWTADLPGGSYSVMVSEIVAVSLHEYVIDGGIRVSEVNVDTKGAQMVRFYYLEPNIPTPGNGVGEGTINALKDRAQQVMDRTGTADVWRNVTKNYPTTTHARTVEYRLPDKEMLKNLFDNVRKSWLNRKSSTFRP